MNKVYIIKYEDRILRVYTSEIEAEKYYKYVMNLCATGEKFLRGKTIYSSGLDSKLQLFALPVSQEGDNLDMRIGNCHSGAGSSVITYELCPV